ncbi:MAG: S-layer homology domain-containing protein [Defluviitaleaceae bacterium]|nr:S-layer homology domain-containing protein [Defluviitaleaceae bacterium]
MWYNSNVNLNWGGFLRNLRNRLLTAVMAAVMVLPSISAFGDIFILTDEVRATFAGRTNANQLIRNATFDDLSFAWPAEAVVRGVALGAIHGEDNSFRPNDNVTRQEALNTVMRAMGQSGAAAERGAAVSGAFDSAQTMLNNGYSALAIEQEVIPADFNLFGQATRQEVAFIVYNAVIAHSDGHFRPDAALTYIHRFNDWRDISSDYLMAVENVVAASIMNGSDMNFMPRDNVTRGQMAQILSNLDTIFMNIHGLERRLGTVVGIRDAEVAQTAQVSSWQNIYVRVGDGTVDILRREAVISPAAQVNNLDAVVFRAGNVGGLNSLVDGDTIEYFVHTEDGTVWYVNVLHSAINDTTDGRLFSLDVSDMTISLLYGERGDGHRVFTMVDGLISIIDGTPHLLMDGVRYPVANLPYGQTVRLYLRNNVVVGVAFVGSEVLTEEFRGLVVENNPAFGYMVIIDQAGNRRVMRYFQNEMMVQRISHWDRQMQVSYINQLFPSFAFNPLATTIAAIEPGDIVFVRPDVDDASIIAQISAVSNYIMRYGRVVNIVHHENHISLLFEQENGQTAWFEMANNAFITREGRRISPLSIQVGDWARLLVNEAILAPGHTMSSIIEMAIEGDARHITNIVRGNLTGINIIQNTMSIEHAQQLSQVGWVNFNYVGQLNLASNNITYYYNNRRITRDEALRQFGRGGAMVYIAMENHFAGERVAMVSFRSQREERLPSDTVVASANGEFWLAQNMAQSIATDSGTIVRRNGRLVSGLEIMPGDFASVVLSGAGMAAVVDITSAPDTSALQIMRVRVTQVWDGSSFRVSSMSQLFGNNWVFTPIEREFTIDTRTIFMPIGGERSIDNFITYTEDSVFDQVFTVVTDGARAAYVVEQPFANRAIRGTLVSNVVDGQETFMLRNVLVQNPVTNQWNPLSNINNTIMVTIDDTTLIGRNNAIVQPRDLQAGDDVLIMMEAAALSTVPADGAAGTATARIILVD